MPPERKFVIKGQIIMKKFFALCAAVALLTGCSGSRVPVYSDIGEFPDLPNDSITQPPVTSEFPISSEGVSASSTSSAQSASSTSSAQSAGSTSSAVSSPEEKPVLPNRDLRHITVALTNDFTNERTLTIDGETLTVEVKNGDWVTDSVRIGSIVFSKEQDGDRTRFTLNGKHLRKGYVNLELWGNGRILSYRLMHDDEGYSFPDVFEVCAESAAAVNSYKVLSYEQTLRYITKDGTADNANVVLKKIQSLSDKICRGLRTDYEKLRAISRWVSENIYYDHPAYKNGIPAECLTLEYMLERGSSVCGGYAAMTSALCEAQGIKCLHVNGAAITQANCYAEANNGVHHEWNYAIIGGGGIWVDSGWNSGSNLYSAGSYSQNSIDYKYFDIGEEVFALNHKSISAQLRTYFPEN